MKGKKRSKLTIKILMLCLMSLVLYLFTNSPNISLSKTNGKSISLYSIEDDKFIYSKAANKKIGPASLTKLMTSIVAYDNINDFDKYIEVNNSGLDYFYANNYAMVGLSTGDKVKIIDLFYGCILPSGTDASYNLIRITGLSENEFIYLMNDKAREIGMRNTKFDNIVGLDSKENYTTAKDMNILLKYINTEYPRLKEILSSEFHYIDSIDRYIFHTILSDSNNKEEGIVGGKSGSNIESGLNWATYLLLDGKEYIAITMGSDYYLNTKLKKTPRLNDIKFIKNKI